MSVLRKPELLSGHSSSVLCCEVNGTGQLLVSGSEDATARLWDLRTSECCQTFEGFGDNDVTSVTFSRTHEHQLFAAAGTTVRGFDFRGGGACDAFASYEFNRDEINQVAVNRKGTFLAAADDSGEVKIVDLATGSVFKTLRGVHTNICSGVQFHPKKSWEVVTGGLDAKLVTWDFSKGRPLQVFDLNENARAGSETSTQLFNPPLVHSVATPPEDSFSDAGHMAAVSQGDGAVAVYDLDYRDRQQSGKSASSRGAASAKGGGRSHGKSQKNSRMGDRNSDESGRKREDAGNGGDEETSVPGRRCCFGAVHGGHKSVAAYAGFARFGDPGEFLISGGNDGCVNLWRWQETAENRGEAEGESEGEGPSQSRSCASGDGSEDGRQVYSGARKETAKPLLLSLRHAKKVNWLTTSPQGNGKVIVADTSRHLRMYNFQ